jgi:hypothetical protein
MNADEQQPPEVQATDRTTKQTDPEYMLKAVQAFAVGVALLAASFTVTHATLRLIDNLTAPLAMKTFLGVILTMLNVPIGMFGCLGLLLGFSMAGIWEPKQPVQLLSLGMVVCWLVFIFTFLSTI